MTTNKKLKKELKDVKKAFQQMQMACELKEVEQNSKYERLEKRHEKKEKREKLIFRLKIALWSIIIFMAILRGLTLEKTIDLMIRIFGG